MATFFGHYGENLATFNSSDWSHCHACDGRRNIFLQFFLLAKDLIHEVDYDDDEMRLKKIKSTFSKSLQEYKIRFLQQNVFIVDLEV